MAELHVKQFQTQNQSSQGSKALLEDCFEHAEIVTYDLQEASGKTLIMSHDSMDLTIEIILTK